jgi:hypothetical protein
LDVCQVDRVHWCAVRAVHQVKTIWLTRDNEYLLFSINFQTFFL